MNYPLDPTLSAQAQALVAQMTLAEKVRLLFRQRFLASART